MKRVVVLIADIVGSRTIRNRQQFQRELKQVIDGINTTAKKPLLSPITLTLGDEFQAVYGDFHALFPDMIEIMSSIHPYELRIAIAHGPLSTDINPKAALEMDGEAFVQARTLMDKLKPVDHTMIEITTTDTFNLDLFNLCLGLLSKEVARWKLNTLNIFNNLLKRVKKEQIAQAIGITKRAVDKQIATHHLDDYAKMLELVADDLSAGLEIRPDNEK